MTSYFGLCAVPALVRIAAVVALVVPLAPHPPAQSGLPRFEPADCWVDGAWARDVRRECGWLVVPESRGRASTTTVRLAVEIFRAREPSGALPRVFLHGGPGGAGGIRLYSEGIARSELRLHRDVVIYDQRGAGFSEPKLCPAYDTAAEAALADARRACIAELEAQGVDRRAYSTAESCMPVIPSADLVKSLRFWVEGLGLTMDRAMRQDGRLIGCMVHNEHLPFWLNQRAGEGVRLYWAPSDIHGLRARLERLGG